MVASYDLWHGNRAGIFSKEKMSKENCRKKDTWGSIQCKQANDIYTVSHKKWSQLIFVCNFVKTDFNAVFTVRINDERYVMYEHHPNRLITVATLPC